MPFLSAQLQFETQTIHTPHNMPPPTGPHGLLVPTDEFPEAPNSVINHEDLRTVIMATAARLPADTPRDKIIAATFPPSNTFRISSFTAAAIMAWTQGKDLVHTPFSISALPRYFLRVSLRFPDGCSAEKAILQPRSFWIIPSPTTPGDWIGVRGRVRHSATMLQWTAMYLLYIIRKVAALPPDSRVRLAALLGRVEAILAGDTFRNDSGQHFAWITIQSGADCLTNPADPPPCGGFVLPLKTMLTHDVSRGMPPIWPLIPSPSHPHVCEPPHICDMVAALPPTPC